MMTVSYIAGDMIKTISMTQKKISITDVNFKEQEAEKWI